MLLRQWSPKTWFSHTAYPEFFNSAACQGASACLNPSMCAPSRRSHRAARATRPSSCQTLLSMDSVQLEFGPRPSRRLPHEAHRRPRTGARSPARQSSKNLMLALMYDLPTTPNNVQHLHGYRELVEQRGKVTGCCPNPSVDQANQESRPEAGRNGRHGRR